MASTVASCFSRILLLIILLEQQNGGQMNEVENYSYEEDIFTVCSQCDCQKNFPNIDCTSRVLDRFPIWQDGILDGSSNSLLVLDFNYNSFKTIPQLNKSDDICAIHLHRNIIKDIAPFAFTNLINLKTLTLSNNQLSKIPTDAFGSLNGAPLPLETLNLSNNHIASFSADDFKYLSALKNLKIDGNNFAILDPSSIAAMNSLVSLRSLNLSGNGIMELPLTSEEMVARLISLDLSQNKLKNVPEVLRFGEKLNNLTLSGNKRIKELNAQSFLDLHHIQVLEVSDMESLEKIRNGTFVPLKSLEKLICNNNQNLKLVEANSFSHSFDGHANLKKVELRNNKLSALNAAVFKNITLCDIDLTGNKLTCDCGIVWLIADNIHTENKCFYSNGPNDDFPKELNITDFDGYCALEESTLDGLFWATLGILLGLLLLCMAAILARKSCKSKSQNATTAAIPLHYDRQYVRDGAENFNSRVCTKYTRSS